MLLFTGCREVRFWLQSICRNVFVFFYSVLTWTETIQGSLTNALNGLLKIRLLPDWKGKPLEMNF
jgi:hypothetical protein